MAMISSVDLFNSESEFDTDSPFSHDPAMQSDRPESVRPDAPIASAESLKESTDPLLRQKAQSEIDDLVRREGFSVNASSAAFQTPVSTAAPVDAVPKDTRTALMIESVHVSEELLFWVRLLGGIVIAGILIFMGGSSAGFWYCLVWFITHVFI